MNVKIGKCRRDSNHCNVTNRESSCSFFPSFLLSSQQSKWFSKIPCSLDGYVNQLQYNIGEVLLILSTLYHNECQSGIRVCCKLLTSLSYESFKRRNSFFVWSLSAYFSLRIEHRGKKPNWFESELNGKKSPTHRNCLLNQRSSKIVYATKKHGIHSAKVPGQGDGARAHARTNTNFARDCQIPQLNVKGAILSYCACAISCLRTANNEVFVLFIN